MNESTPEAIGPRRRGLACVDGGGDRVASSEQLSAGSAVRLDAQFGIVFLLAQMKTGGRSHDRHSRKRL
jgi:hypothetical protein